MLFIFADADQQFPKQDNITLNPPVSLDNSSSASSSTYVLVDSSGVEDVMSEKAEQTRRESLLQLTQTIIRLLSITIATSAPDVEIFIKLGGTRCLLTRLLPASPFPLLPLVRDTLDLLAEVFVVIVSEDTLMSLLEVLPVVGTLLRFEVRIWRPSYFSTSTSLPINMLECLLLSVV